MNTIKSLNKEFATTKSEFQFGIKIDQESCCVALPILAKNFAVLDFYIL